MVVCTSDSVRNEDDESVECVTNVSIFAVIAVCVCLFSVRRRYND